MTATKLFPLGQPAFVTHPLDRAAHLRGNDAKLMAMEERGDTRAFVVHRDSLLVKHEPDGPRAELTIKEALALGAKGCLIGRAYIYGLAAMGQKGVTKALDLIREELKVTMSLTGVKDINDVTRDVLYGFERKGRNA